MEHCLDCLQLFCRCSTGSSSSCCCAKDTLPPEITVKAHVNCCVQGSVDITDAASLDPPQEEGKEGGGEEPKKRRRCPLRNLLRLRRGGSIEEHTRIPLPPCQVASSRPVQGDGSPLPHPTDQLHTASKTGTQQLCPTKDQSESATDTNRGRSNGHARPGSLE